MEEDILKRDLSKAETPEAIQEIKQSAEDMGIDIEKLVNERLAAISTKAEVAETTTPGQVAQVESMGGSMDEIEKRTEGVDQKIGEVKAEARERIEKAQGEQSPVEVTQQKESPADIALKQIREKLDADKDLRQNKVVIDNKLVDIAEITANPDLVKQIDWTRPASLKTAGSLLESGVVSSKEVLKGIAKLQITVLEDIPMVILKRLKEENSLDFTQTLESMIEKNKSGLNDSLLAISYVANIVRMPGWGAATSKLGLKDNILKIRDKFVESSNKDPEAMIRTTEGLPALFDASERKLVEREDLMRWLKDGMSSEDMNMPTFRLSVRKILDLESRGKISTEEAEDIIKNNPNYQKYLG
ncbi:MAG: hypothetical protein WCT29_02660 [Candidatus Paceibacterota bacterium]|jgi:hypothetical protein